MRVRVEGKDPLCSPAQRNPKYRDFCLPEQLIQRAAMACWAALRGPHELGSKISPGHAELLDGAGSSSTRYGFGGKTTVLPRNRYEAA